ncbi:MAG: polysaccharide deacetylase family protein [Oscillospiraceae bacterium]|nr:polysaccharide deacetylase family protein [Oscillospiraceae bacterium]
MKKTLIIVAVLLLTVSNFRAAAQAHNTYNNHNNQNHHSKRSKRSWGQGKNTDELNRPVSCMEFNNKYGKYSAIFINEDSRDITLTFDQGYENGYTDKILDILSEKDVRAIFFVTYGYVKKNAGLIKRMIDDGHVIGNHSYRHKSMPALGEKAQEEEILFLHRYIKENFDYNMNLFRSPMGEFSEQSLAVAQGLGYSTVFWSFAYLDYEVERQPAPSAALNTLIHAAHPGAIYLLHTASKTNADILAQMIDGIRAEGFEFDV